MQAGSPDRVNRRLAAIFAADVVGYSRLMEADEEGTARQLREHHAAADRLVAEFGGRIVKTTGDGILIEFPSVVDAVQCAVALQQLMSERNAGAPSNRRMEWRIGIHLGDILIEGEDILGDGVNLAARLEGIAEPGGICISEDAFRQVRGKIETEFLDGGEQALKNIARPMRIYRAHPASVPVSSASPATIALPLPDRPSIAVLPFRNMSGDPEQEYFADGMVEEIITAFSRIRWLFERAIERDPDYGAALAWAAVCSMRLYVDGTGQDRDADRRKGIDFARRALRVAGDDPATLANAALALAAFGENNSTMMTLVERALAVNPSFARGWYISAILKSYAGQNDVAIEHDEASLRLSPRGRFGTVFWVIGGAHFFRRRFAEAVPKLLLAIQDNPEFTEPYRYLAACYAHMGCLDEAREVVARLRAFTDVVMPNAITGIPDQRELLLSGLRQAMGEIE